jgi:hypothetical protein
MTIPLLRLVRLNCSFQLVLCKDNLPSCWSLLISEDIEIVSLKDIGGSDVKDDNLSRFKYLSLPTSHLKYL